MTATITNHHAKIDTVEGMGTITFAYTESVLELGSLAYSETTTYAFLDGHTTVYVCDLVQMRSGRWALADSCDDSRLGTHVESYDSPAAEWAEGWVRARRAEHSL